MISQTVCLIAVVCVFSVVGPSESPHGSIVGRAGVEEEETGKIKRRGE